MPKPVMGLSDTVCENCRAQQVLKEGDTILKHENFMRDMLTRYGGMIDFDVIPTILQFASSPTPEPKDFTPFGTTSTLSAATEGEAPPVDHVKVLMGKVQVLETDIARLQRENAQLRGEKNSLDSRRRVVERERQSLEAQVAMMNKITEAYKAHVLFIEENIDFIVMSVHPDKHGNSMKANEVTKFFLAIREVVKKGGTWKIR